MALTCSFDELTERLRPGGGMLLGTGPATDTYWLVDSRNAQVLIATLNTGTGSTDAMEGCEDCHLVGMLAYLAT